MPNFLIVGAIKAGTSSLYEYLKQHPQIYMSPEKEPEFFIFDDIKKKPVFDEANLRDEIERYHEYYERIIEYYSRRIDNIEAYSALFQRVSTEIAIGEASANYLSHIRAPERIHHYIPNIKLIVILRNPVDRAYSEFQFFRMIGWEPLDDFGQALKEEEVRRRKQSLLPCNYKQRGFYHVHLKRYFDRFEQRQIKVYIYEEFVNNPLMVLRDIFGFLGVDESFAPNVSVRYNVTKSENKIRGYLYSLLVFKPNPIKKVSKLFIPNDLRKYMSSKLLKLIRVKPPPVKPEIKKSLTEVFHDDIMKLQNLINRDLSKWLK